MLFRVFYETPSKSAKAEIEAETPIEAGNIIRKKHKKVFITKVKRVRS